MRYFIATALVFLFFPLTALAYDTIGEPPPSPFAIRGNEPNLRNYILITIDDCSIEANVRWMFEFLNNRGQKATFFPNTKHMLKQDPQLWRDIVAAGFEIAYHTRLHTPGMTPDQLTQDFALFQAEVRQILDDPSYTIRYVRPPGGVWNADWLQWSQSAGLYTVYWNAVPPVEASYLEGVLRHERGGGILLLHTTLSNMDWLRDNLEMLMSLRTDTNEPYLITTISNAMND